MLQGTLQSNRLTFFHCSPTLWRKFCSFHSGPKYGDIEMEINYNCALVTGGAGFIGSHLVGELIDRGYDVRVLDNLSTGSLTNLAHVKDRMTFYEGDIRDRDLLEKAVEGCKVIFHQAAVVSVPETVEDPIGSAAVNESGTLYILEAARKQQVKRVVLASSCAVYGNDPQLPKHERMQLIPESPYAVQNHTGERYARIYPKLYGVETVCLRYFNVFGPRQNPSSPYSGVISIFMTRAASGASPVIYGDGNQSRDFIFVKDVVTANLLAASTDGIGGRVFNVGTGNGVTIYRLIQMLCEILKRDIKTIEILEEQGTVGDPINNVADCSKIHKVLGFSPDFDLKKGLRKLIELRSQKNGIMFIEKGINNEENI